MKLKTFFSFLAMVVGVVFLLSSCSGNVIDTGSGNSSATSAPVHTISGDQNVNEDNQNPSESANRPTSEPDNQTKGRVTNVTSPEFQLTDGFIVPVVQQKTVPDGYIGIYSADDFDKIRLNKSAKYILMTDIDISLITDWKAIPYFTGVLDGNGFIVKNTTNVIDAVFLYVENGTIMNLGVEINCSFPVLDLAELNLPGIDLSEYSLLEIYELLADMATDGEKTEYGPMAGIAEIIQNTTISNCYVSGQISANTALMKGNDTGPVDKAGFPGG